MFWFKRRKKLQEENVEETAYALEVPEAEDKAEETPTEESPAEETPAVEIPVEETPVEEKTAEESPAEETPQEEPASEEDAEESDSREETVPEENREEESVEPGVPEFTEAPEEPETVEPQEEPVVPVVPVVPEAPETPEVSQAPAEPQPEPEVPAEPEPEAPVAPVIPAPETPEEAPEASAPQPAPEAAPTPQPEPQPQPQPAPTPQPQPRPIAHAVPKKYEPTQEEIDARLPAREPEPRHGHFLGFLIFLLMIAIGGAYYYGRVYTQDHFLHGTYINGENVSNMTIEEVEQIFEKKVSNYHIDLTFRGGETETIRGSQFSYHSAPDGSLDKIMASQDPNWWFMGFFEKREAQIPENKSFDEEQLRQAVLALPEFQESNMIVPSDAYVIFQDGEYVIVPHTEGTLIDAQKVADAAVETVRAEALEIEVESLGAYAEPAVRMDNEELVAYRDQLNTWTSGGITYYLPNGEEMTLDSTALRDWLSTDEDGKLYKDDDVWEEKIEIFVDNLAMRVNTVGDTRTFKSTNAGEISMKGGDYGYSVNKPAEREAIWDLLEEGETEDREPMYYTREYGDDPSINDGIGDTYIEANLSSQHVWIYVDGNMVCETDCVSGNVNLGRGTPTGVFQILYKDTDVDLKGQQLANGRYSYISHVNYWMPFYNGCGFHDADWRTKFGGTIYKVDGSHGCINLPKEIVPTFYGYVKKGMPVVVYY